MKNEELIVDKEEMIIDNGELTMEGWEEKLLIKATKFRPGKAQVKNLSHLECSFVPMKDLNERQIDFEPKEQRKIKEVYKGYTYFQDDDVLLAKVTPCFQNRKAGVAKNLTNGIGFGSSEFFVFRPSEDILPEFIYYFFMTEDFINNGVANMSGAVGLKRVSNTYIKSVKIPLPPLPEQRRIVSKLDALFAEIDASLALIDQNIEQAEALKLSVLDKEFGKIGSQYKMPLKKIMRVINGRAYKKEEMLSEGKYPILRVGNFFTNREWYFSDMELDKDKYCESGDLLYAWSASFGPKIWNGGKSIFHYHIWKLEPINADVVSKEFMYYQLEYDTEEMKAEGGRGVGMIHLTKGGIERRKFVLPPIQLLSKIKW